MQAFKQSLVLAALACGISSTALASSVDEATLKQKIGALKVMTQQFATAAKTSIESAQRLAEAQIASVAYMNTTIGQMEVYQSFNPYTGQGPKFCDAVSNSKDIVAISTKRDNFDLGNTNRAGRTKVAPDRYSELRVKSNLDKYCTADQHNLGICRARFDGLNGASSNYSKLAEIEQFTKGQFEAANEFIANLVPVPSKEIMTKKGGNCGVGCENAYVNAMQADAFSSMVAFGAKSSFSSQIGTKTFAPSR